MPLYFFHVRSSAGETLDPEGSSCADLDAARRQAIAGIRSIISEEVKDGHLPLDERLDVEDEQGRVLMSLAFTEALALPPELASALAEAPRP